VAEPQTGFHFAETRRPASHADRAFQIVIPSPTATSTWRGRPAGMTASCWRRNPSGKAPLSTEERPAMLEEISRPVAPGGGELRRITLWRWWWRRRGAG
jgi:hypothetical protein